MLRDKNGSSHPKNIFGPSASMIRHNLISLNTWKTNYEEIVQNMALNGTLEKLSNFSKNIVKFNLIKLDKNFNTTSEPK